MVKEVRRSSLDMGRGREHVGWAGQNLVLIVVVRASLTELVIIRQGGEFSQTTI